MTERPSFFPVPEDEHSSEYRRNSPLATSIAQRIVTNEYEKGFSQAEALDVVIPEFPSFIKDAVIDSYAKGIDAAIKTPTPFAYFFDSERHRVDNISDHDLIAFVDEYDAIQDISPLQLKLMIRAAIQETSCKVRPVEQNFTHFMNMLKMMPVVAEQHNVPNEKVFENDSLYAELIRESITKEDYLTYFLDQINNITPEALLQDSIRMNLHFKEVMNNPESVELNGYIPDEEEVTSYIQKYRDDHETMKHFEVISFTITTHEKEDLNNRVKEIWPETLENVTL